MMPFKKTKQNKRNLKTTLNVTLSSHSKEEVRHIDTPSAAPCHWFWRNFPKAQRCPQFKLRPRCLPSPSLICCFRAAVALTLLPIAPQVSEDRRQRYIDLLLQQVPPICPLYHIPGRDFALDFFWWTNFVTRNCQKLSGPF